MRRLLGAEGALMVENRDQAIDAYGEVFERMETARAQLSDALFREAVAMTLAALLLAEGDLASRDYPRAIGQKR